MLRVAGARRRYHRRSESEYPCPERHRFRRYGIYTIRGRQRSEGQEGAGTRGIFLLRGDCPSHHSSQRARSTCPVCEEVGREEHKHRGLLSDYRQRFEERERRVCSFPSRDCSSGPLRLSASHSAESHSDWSAYWPGYSRLRGSSLNRIYLFRQAARKVEKITRESASEKVAGKRVVRARC